MININKDDIINIKDFPLIWRWNRSTHSVFSDDELKSIVALNNDKASELNDYIMAIYNNYKDKYDSLLDIKDGDDKTIIQWLRKSIGEEKILYISWDKEMGMKIPSVLFINRWSDFCYPSSDDIFILPSSGYWLLEYWHFERFVWKKIY